MYAGQLLASTMSYSCSARFRVQDLLQRWQVKRFHHVLVRLTKDARFPRETELFDSVTSLDPVECTGGRWTWHLSSCRGLQQSPTDKNKVQGQRSTGLRHWWGECPMEFTSHSQQNLAALPKRLMKNG